MKTQSLAAGRQTASHPGTPLVPWIGAGVLAGLALVAAILGLRLLTGVPALPEIVQDRLLELAPGSVVGLLIDRLQFWGKPLLLAAWAAVQTVLCAAAGALFGRLVGQRGIPRGRQILAAGALAGLAFWALFELAALPLLGLGPLGSHTPEGPASAGWSLLAFVAFGLLLAAVEPLFAGGAADGRALPDAAADERRRMLLRLAAVGGVTSLAGLALWRVAAGIGERGTPASRAAAGPATAGAQPSGDGFAAPPGISAEITPSDQFYVISKNLVDPTVSAAGWTLELAGMVSTPRRLSYDELKALPAQDLYATLECISNPVGGNLISTTRWTGVPLGPLLDRAGVQGGADWVVFTSTDGYQEALPLEQARQPTTMLAHSMNGAPLTSKHGFPVRLLTTGRYGMKNPKWLTKIETAAKPPTGYWEKQGWNAEEGVETMARFDTRPQKIGAGASALLGGVAFAGSRGVSRIEVSADGGETWSAGQLKAPLSPFTWSLWSYDWPAGDTGTRTLLVRAVDGNGAPQAYPHRASHPNGATGYHSIRVEVASA